MSDFIRRHIGPTDEQQTKMIHDLGLTNLDSLVREVVPDSILYRSLDDVPVGLNENTALAELKEIMSENVIKRSLIGQGYYGTITPPVIQRNVLENPSWYTSYTPYQAEISQGRLEALFNYQTLITELVGLPIANASLLDEGTAAAEAMILAYNNTKDKNTFIVDKYIYPQTYEVLQTRARPLGIKIVTMDIFSSISIEDFVDDAFGMIMQMPNVDGKVKIMDGLISWCKDLKVMTIAAVDPMAQVLMKPVGHMGFDIAVGSMQRFGVPMGFGGPHAAFFAITDKHKRKIPGRIVGQSVDNEGNKCYRLALQTREQHIRRDKATSNICTAQALLANMAGFYAAYHGPDGLMAIALRIRRLRATLIRALTWSGIEVEDTEGFDTVRFKSQARLHNFNVKYDYQGWVTLSLDELTTLDEVKDIVDSQNDFVSTGVSIKAVWDSTLDTQWIGIPERDLPFLEQDIFNKYHSETDMMRYIYELGAKDFSLVNGMIPLGSCTMKLNAASELMPVTWDEMNLHPMVPMDQSKGYTKIIDDLKKWLCDITGFDTVSLQPIAVSHGEYAGLLAILDYHKHNENPKRNVCLIPKSAHGTNPASAVMAGMKVVTVDCDDKGNVDIHDLRIKACLEADELACCMITYPSTHGVFESTVKEICSIVHEFGGQVYLDGANLNAQVGLAKPCEYGADVCHMNLHKTFCIPHGGGGPGVGPIGVAKHLSPFISQRVSAVPQGSASILPISWMYIRMMGADGLRKASAVSLLSANWIAQEIDEFFPVLYKASNGRVAHECIIDCRNLPVTAEDVAKRLMDYGFHAPTLSWPVAGTMMIEPTESESLDELKRFVSSLKSIREEIDTIPEILKNAPHTSKVCTKTEWKYPYSREQAAYPMNQTNKFWASVSRIDNVYGDRNLVCACS